MNARQRMLRLGQLDRTLTPLSVLRTATPPRGGWIRAIREALGMGLESMADRLGLTSASAVLLLEKREAADSITLRRLRDAADALGCDLIVAVIPREPLLVQAQRQSLEQARKQLRRVDHTMELEAQGVTSPEKRDIEQQLANDILMKGGRALWG